MFSKLFKYDFRSIKRFGIPALFIILGATVLGSLDIIGIINLISDLSKAEEPSGGSVVLIILGILFFYAVIFALLGAFLLVQVMVLVDFYKSLVSDEGYLTFTLPVKAKDIILSKATNSLAWNAILLLATIVSVFIMIIVLVFGIVTVAPDLGQGGTTDTSGLGWNGNMTVYAVILIIYAIVYFINSQILYFLAIFVGSILTRKHKALAAIGCVVGVNFIYGTVTGIISAISMVSTGIFGGFSSDPIVGMNIGMGIFTAVLAGLTVLFFFLLKHLMENKLNLE